MFISYKEYEFKEVLDLLRSGFIFKRKYWDETEFIYYQIKNSFDIDKIDSFTSVPDNAKKYLKETKERIEFKNQIMYVKRDGTITQWTPQTEDLFSDDWIMINID